MLDKMCIKVPNIKQMKTGYCAKGLVSVQEHPPRPQFIRYTNKCNLEA